MRKSKQLYEYLNWFDFDNLFEVANTIADYKEWKHKDYRELNELHYKLAEQYIKENRIVLDWEERTREYEN